MTLSATPHMGAGGQPNESCFFFFMPAAAASHSNPSRLQLVERVPQLEERTKQRQSPNKTQLLLARCIEWRWLRAQVARRIVRRLTFRVNLGAADVFIFSWVTSQVDSCTLFRGHSLVPSRIYAFSFLFVAS